MGGTDSVFTVNDVVINTARLTIRPWRQADLDDFYEYASVEGVGEAAGWPHHTDKNASAAVLADFIGEGEVFALEYRENGKVIGSLGVHKVHPYTHEYDRYVMREIGYVLSKEYWGKGLMTEAVSAVIDYLFTQTDIELLICGHFTENGRSRRVIEKCGFKPWVERQFFAKQLDRHFTCREYVLFNPSLKPLPKVKVLFIGNSHTYFNDMAHTFEILARKKGINAEAVMISHGRQKLTVHAKEPEVRYNILHGGYDYVVLQDHGHPFYGEQALLEGAGEIKKFADSVFSKTVLYMTWPAKGHAEDLEQISGGYRSAAEKLGARLAPVGEYWQAAADSFPDAELYNADGKHASPLGSYLAATVLYYSIFESDRMPEKLDLNELARDTDMLRIYPQQQ